MAKFEMSDTTSWSELLEGMDNIADAVQTIPSAEDDISNLPIPANNEPEPSGDDLLDELNKLFTPILVMQGYENEIGDKVQETLSEASVLNEKTIMQFDPSTRMSQLLWVCAALIAKKKNTEKWQMWKKAATIAKNMKVEIQKDEYDEAKILAQKYLVKVSTSNGSSVARKAADELLPETQH